MTAPDNTTLCQFGDDLFPVGGTEFSPEQVIFLLSYAIVRPYGVRSRGRSPAWSPRVQLIGVTDDTTFRASWTSSARLRFLAHSSITFNASRAASVR